MRTYAIDGAKLAPEPKPPAQDTARHTPKAAANHLSAAEQKKHDEQRVDEDAAALKRVQASKPLYPPHRCQLCGSPRNAIRKCSRPGCKDAV